MLPRMRNIVVLEWKGRCRSIDKMPHHTTVFNFPLTKGALKYLVGNSCCWNPNAEETNMTCCGKAREETKKELFPTLTFWPEKD